MTNTYPNDTIAECVGNGLTKREHFAAMAMQGYCAHNEIGRKHEDDVAKYSVATADALINALNQQGETNNG